jgi:hypothetical protein
MFLVVWFCSSERWISGSAGPANWRQPQENRSRLHTYFVALREVQLLMTGGLYFRLKYHITPYNNITFLTLLTLIFSYHAVFLPLFS